MTHLTHAPAKGNFRHDDIERDCPRPSARRPFAELFVGGGGADLCVNMLSVWRHGIREDVDLLEEARAGVEFAKERGEVFCYVEGEEGN